MLLRQYLKLNAKLLGFSIDPAFGNVLDGLVVVDLDDVEPAILTRYMGKEAAAAFRNGGAHPDVVARAILDAVRTNPSVRPVGRDAWALWAVTRVAPSAAARLGAVLSRRLGAAG